MANTSVVYVRIDTNLKDNKDNAESILSQLGISPSSAIQMFYSQIVLKKGVQRNNQTYRMLVSICQLIIEGMLITTDSGDYRLASFVDEQWSYVKI